MKCTTLIHNIGQWYSRRFINTFNANDELSRQLTCMVVSATNEYTRHSVHVSQAVYRHIDRNHPGIWPEQTC